MNAYFFVLATIIAILPLLFIFKVSIERIKEQPKKFQKIFTQFILWATIFEIIPIILIIYSLANVEPVAKTSDLYMPGIIVLLTAGFVAFFVFLQMKVDIVPEAKEMIQRFCLIAFMLMVAVPMMAIVGLFTMMPIE